MANPDQDTGAPRVVVSYDGRERIVKWYSLTAAYDVPRVKLYPEHAEGKAETPAPSNSSLVDDVRAIRFSSDQARLGTHSIRAHLDEVETKVDAIGAKVLELSAHVARLVALFEPTR